MDIYVIIFMGNRWLEEQFIINANSADKALEVFYKKSDRSEDVYGVELHKIETIVEMLKQWARLV